MGLFLKFLLGCRIRVFMVFFRVWGFIESGGSVGLYGVTGCSMGLTGL